MTIDASGAPLLEFIEVMRRLRAECPWKQEQTHRSLARFLTEELHETLEAIEVGSSADLCEELGDLLLQIYFHAVIAEESGDFTIDDVAAGILAKMRRRNPHVFGPATEGEAPTPGDAAAVNELWESVKAAEKQRAAVTDGLPPALPALLYAGKVLDRLARDGHPTGVPDTIAPDSQASQADLGDRLLGLVAEALAARVDPEQALRDAVRRCLPE